MGNFGQRLKQQTSLCQAGGKHDFAQGSRSHRLLACGEEAVRVLFQVTPALRGLGAGKMVFFWFWGRQSPEVLRLGLTCERCLFACLLSWMDRMALHRALPKLKTAWDSVSQEPKMKWRRTNWLTRQEMVFFLSCFVEHRISLEQLSVAFPLITH